MGEHTDETMRRARQARDRLDRELLAIDEVTMVDIGMGPAASGTAAVADPVLRVHVRQAPDVDLPKHWEGFTVIVVPGDYRPDDGPTPTTNDKDQ